MTSTPATQRTLQLEAEPEAAGLRLDRWLAGRIAELSRSRIQALIREGFVKSGETIREPRTPVKSGGVYVVAIPAAEPSSVVPEEMPLRIVYEDASLIVIDKPPGLVVHPGAGHASGTLVNALVAHCGDSLSGIGGVKRPGIVHRLDKDTTGLLVVAKTDAAHQHLSEQFKSHGRDGRLHRSYLAFVWGALPRASGSIDVALARSEKNRTKIAVVGAGKGRSAKTHYETVEIFLGSDNAATVSLLRLVLETGRTHQIRVHLSHIGHPVLGDAVYGAGFRTRASRLNERARSALENLGRQALHAETLAFEHPETGRLLRFQSALAADLENLGEALRSRAQSKATERRRGKR